jgi:choline dehydrogenase-like flavoprotein
VVGVSYKTEPNGPEEVVKAPLVFVSIQAIESARLFLLSNVPDPNDMIGHYLTYHTKGTVEMTFRGQPVWDEGPERTFQPRTSLGTLQLRDLYVIKDKKRPELTKGGKFSISDPFTMTPLIKAATRSSYRNAARPDLSKAKDVWGKALVERLLELRNQGGVAFSFTGETMSTHANRVELDPLAKDPWGLAAARVHYKHHRYDLAISKYCLDKMVDVMESSGGELRKYEPQAEANEGYGHNHGTLRAGTDPGASILDANCQSHTVKGLRVLDSAFMPTAGASNPTLTQIANAYRVCLNL